MIITQEHLIHARPTINIHNIVLPIFLIRNYYVNVSFRICLYVYLAGNEEVSGGEIETIWDTHDFYLYYS